VRHVVFFVRLGGKVVIQFLTPRLDIPLQPRQSHVAQQRLSQREQLALFQSHVAVNPLHQPVNLGNKCLVVRATCLDLRQMGLEGLMLLPSRAHHGRGFAISLPVHMRLESRIQDVRYDSFVQFQFTQNAIGEKIPVVAPGCLKPFEFTLNVFVIPLQELQRALTSGGPMRLSTTAHPGPGRDIVGRIARSHSLHLQHMNASIQTLSCHHGAPTGFFPSSFANMTLVSEVKDGLRRKRFSDLEQPLQQA